MRAKREVWRERQGGRRLTLELTLVLQEKRVKRGARSGEDARHADPRHRSRAASIADAAPGRGATREAVLLLASEKRDHAADLQDHALPLHSRKLLTEEQARGGGDEERRRGLGD